MKVAENMRWGMLILIIGNLISQQVSCQYQDEQALDSGWNGKKALVWGAGVTIGAGTLISLDKIWYAQYERSSFHWFDDSKEWLGQDKAGHHTTAYYIARGGASSLIWAGYSRKKSALFSSAVSFAFLSGLEYLDGTSTRWGASASDFIANTSGIVLYLGQEMIWENQYVFPQFSFHRTGWADQRPELLGSSWNERWLKDYNGQTYWLTTDFSAFDRDIKWPKWLGVSLGYGIDGMISADPATSDLLGANPTSQWYFAPAILLHNIRFRQKWASQVAGMLILFKFPTPALEWSGRDGLQFKPLYF